MAHKNGKKVIGICGGYQMLGNVIEDPMHVESTVDAVPGLGLIPLKTILEEEKITQQTTFQFKDYEDKCKGYEIHMGKTILENTEFALNKIAENQYEGFKFANNSWGSYIHGILDNRVVIDDLLKDFMDMKSVESFDFETFKNEQYDKLADHLRKHIDMNLIYQQIQ